MLFLFSDHEIIDVAKQPNEREFMMKHGIKNKGKLFQYESQEVKNIYILLSLCNFSLFLATTCPPTRQRIA